MKIFTFLSLSCAAILTSTSANAFEIKCEVAREVGALPKPHDIFSQNIAFKPSDNGGARIDSVRLPNTNTGLSWYKDGTIALFVYKPDGHSISRNFVNFSKNGVVPDQYDFSTILDEVTEFNDQPMYVRVTCQQ